MVIIILSIEKRDSRIQHHHKYIGYTEIHMKLQYMYIHRYIYMHKFYHAKGIRWSNKLLMGLFASMTIRK